LEKIKGPEIVMRIWKRIKAATGKKYVKFGIKNDCMMGEEDIITKINSRERQILAAKIIEF
jgi:hypothetical protein